MQVHYGEGVANHTGPESCAVYREVCGEALTGERAGQPLSYEIFLIQDADVVSFAEGKTNGRDNASARTVLRGRSLSRDVDSSHIPTSGPWVVI